MTLGETIIAGGLFLFVYFFIRQTFLEAESALANQRMDRLEDLLRELLAEDDREDDK